VIARSRTFVVLLGAVAAAAAGVVLRHGRGAMRRGVPGWDPHPRCRPLRHSEPPAPAGLAVRADRCRHRRGRPGWAGMCSRLGAGLADCRSCWLAGTLGVTGLDLDPAMIERAIRNADRIEDGNGRRPPAVVPRRRRRLTGVPRRIVRPGGQYVIDAPLGRPNGGFGRDRPRAATGWPCTRLGLPGRPRAAARASTRPGRACARLSASRGRRNAVAVAVAIQPNPADRARARRRRAPPPYGNVDPGPTRRLRRAMSPRYREVRCSTPSSSRLRLP
jgi:hypothetical protein